MKIIQLLTDHHVPHKTEGHKHCRPGWVQTKCPFCVGNPGWHMGWNLDSGTTVCWRCGFHPTRDSLAAVLKLPPAEATKLLRQYGWRSRARTKPQDPFQKSQPIHPTSLSLPAESRPISQRHRDYLITRNFDPDQIVEVWGVLGTTHLGTHPQRIIIPIIFENRLVSFTSRDITGRALAKYMSCPLEDEVVQHKHILYGLDQAQGVQTAIIVEGPIDAWRLGPGTVATFGIEYTISQVKLLAERFSKLFVLFDNDPQAQAKGEQLALELHSLGKDALLVELPEAGSNDPGGLSPEEAQALKKDLLGI